ncbi:hypothetical protein TNCT_646341 [Trichonephila clavata]|uniref:Uncharacterized protein n=1 Tax=Trichonephila clavata TaxID=2740835 RepID=A0A8X6LDK6_TRICU|nr:hypothetical protein TNCT_646341 [Trichonephila clavata]
MASTNDHSLIMDLSLPPSGNSSRPETPTYLHCQRLKRTADDIRKFTKLTDGTTSLIKSMKYDGFDSDDDPSIQDLKCRLSHYQNYLAMAVSDFNSLPYCDTPNCEVHHTPPQSPTLDIMEFPELCKKAPLKRKENEDGFTSPPSRKLSKSQRVYSNPELGFNLQLENKFSQLQDQQPEGNSSANATNISVPTPDTANTKRTTVPTPDKNTPKHLPPPTFLEITTDYRIHVKTLTKYIPKLRTKMTGDYLKLYTDNSEDYYKLNN